MGWISHILSIVRLSSELISEEEKKMQHNEVQLLPLTLCSQVEFLKSRLQSHFIQDIGVAS